MVDESDETWRCWRHNVTGNAMHLIGMKHGIIECGDWISASLDDSTWGKICDIAREEGYDLPNPEAVDRSNPWPEIRTAFKSKEREDEKRAVKLAAEQLCDELHLLTHKESKVVYRYDEQAGIYRRDGEDAIRERLADDTALGPHYSRTRVENIIHLVKSLTFASEDELGGPEDKICVANGVLDLSDATNPTLMEHDPEYRFVNQFPVEYDSDASCPRWREWIEEMVFADDRKPLQEYAGYCLQTEGFAFKKALLLLGPTNSGKSTFLNVMNALFGRESTSRTPVQKLADDRFAVADLHGKIANIANELPDWRMQNVGTFKELTGGEASIRAERKYEHPFTFTPTAKHLYAANQVPKVRNADDAFMNRWVLASFPNELSEQRINETRAELGMGLDQWFITEELPGILNWVLEGYASLFGHDGNLPGFTDERPLDSKHDFWRSFGDAIKRFTTFCLKVTNDPDDVLPTSRIYEVYEAFCDNRGLPVEVQQTVTRELKQHPDINASHRTPSYRESQCRCLVGVQFTAEAKTLLANHMYRNSSKGEA